MTTPNVSSSEYSTIITQTTQVQKEKAERLTCRISPLYVKPTWTTVILYGSNIQKRGTVSSSCHLPNPEVLECSTYIQYN